MSLAPSAVAPRTAFNPLPIYIGLFCLLWSFAFVAGKIGVTYCPPPILLAARFLLAGILIFLISAFRGEAWRMESWQMTWRDAAIFAILGVAALSTALAFIIYFRILATAGATNLLLVTFLIPVSAILLGVLILHEALLPKHLLGMAMIALGLAAIDGRPWKMVRRAFVAA